MLVKIIFGSTLIFVIAVFVFVVSQWFFGFLKILFGNPNHKRKR